MKILFLLPPSEGKNLENLYKQESLTFDFNKPYDIWIYATQKDLKCSWTRYEEWIELNKNILSWWTLESIKRYSWVMYNAIDYAWMNESWKNYFNDNFLILSWMYWLVKPQDKIANYKLPIETKWLYDYWSDKVAKKTSSLDYDIVVNLLPISYAKLIWLWTNCSKHRKKLDIILQSWKKVVNVNFLKQDWKKISHWVKKIKWEWIKNICENNISDLDSFWWNKKLISSWLYEIDIVTKK